ncbi:MAG: ABC transporter substrate-binding protein [Candidatus Cyclonatronum sp.]|uniref:MlaC/ttg2D family ABC transporter substrate-binding protein n=1 Tax=Cyclonatronum sp. TaxID=3024185 RepID=UPI0025C68A56|nr:ABC transporter substrate-binding protein [Cyclonatronum sp.]MCC5934832.1 ABC transporter substrate-binding protein [Balneolales bacterium]MCH8485362.1 ABC transporter substrate-binding protein [Cyclonatronum sp.]
MKVFVLLFSIFIGTFVHNTVQAATADQAIIHEVREMLIDRDQEIKALLGPEGTEHTDAQRDELMDIINQIIDYEAMARHALQETWGTLTQAQREEFVDVFARVIRDQSLNSLEIYRADVTYESFEVNGNFVTAHTIATLENVRTPVIYELENRAGEWFVIDMSVDNVSTAESYRRSFQRIIQRRGFDALMDNLRRRAGVS